VGVAIVLALLLGFWTIPMDAAPAPKVFRYNLDRDEYPLDIGKTNNMLAYNFFASLTRIDPTGKIIPGAAQSWTVSNDGRTFTFRLRRDMKWSDGTPLTARDFEFGWKRAVDPATRSARAWQHYPVQGAEDFHRGKGRREDIAVRAVDDFTFTVTLINPGPFWPGYIGAHPVFFAQPAHIIQKVGDNWMRPENLVFSGPFKVTRYVPNSVVVMEANPGWPLSRPKVDRVEAYVVPSEATTLAKYQANELDLAVNIPLGEIQLIRRNPALQREYLLLPEWRVMSLQLNLKKPPLDALKVRQAILYAINQRALTGGPFRGVFTPAYSFRTPNFPVRKPDFLRTTYDRAKARELLAEAGYPNGRGFPELTIAVWGDLLRVGAEYLQQQFRDVLNIPVRIEVMDLTTFAQMANEGRHQMLLFAQFALAPDLFDLYARVQGQALVNLGWDDERFNRLLVQAQVERDPARRLKLYDDAERYAVIENAVMIPLWNTDAPSLVKPYVRGLREDKRPRWVHSWEYVDIAR
jgi:oligopeptide transport system substrate-binding protein